MGPRRTWRVCANGSRRKHQIPSSKLQAPSSKLQEPNSNRRSDMVGVWCLEFLWSLEFGAFTAFYAAPFIYPKYSTNLPFISFLGTLASISPWSSRNSEV